MKVLDWMIAALQNNVITPEEANDFSDWVEENYEGKDIAIPDRFYDMMDRIALFETDCGSMQ